MASENKKSDVEEIKRSSENGKSFEAQLSEATKDLIYISETDANFETVVWQLETDAASFSAIDSSLMLQLTKKPRETPIREQTLEDFFRFPTTDQDWHDDGDKAMVRRYQNLKNLLEQNLRDAKVFKIGAVEVDVYIIGIDRDGNLAGVKTTAVET